MKRVLFYMFILLSFMVFIVNAYAIDGPPVEILETFYEYSGEYHVVNNSDTPIYAFAVANNSLNFAAGSADMTGYERAWAFSILDKETWNDGYDFSDRYWAAVTEFPEGGPVGYTDGSPLWNAIPDTTGTFETYFGTEYDKVIIFYTSFNADAYLFNNPLGNGESDTFTFYADYIASPFVVFDQDGNAFYTGEATAVPIPAAIWLLSSGIAAIIGIRRKIVKG